MTRYDLSLEPEVHTARKTLPGYVRQQVRRAIDALAQNPRPPQSRALDTAGLRTPRGVEIRRLRLGVWRLIYAVHEKERWVWVLAVRRRPPYDYQDLSTLVELVDN